MSTEVLLIIIALLRNSMQNTALTVSMSGKGHMAHCCPDFLDPQATFLRTKVVLLGTPHPNLKNMVDAH